MKRGLCWLLLLAMIGLAGCGLLSPDSDDEQVATGASIYMPLSVGNEWVYTQTQNNPVVKLEKIGVSAVVDTFGYEYYQFDRYKWDDESDTGWLGPVYTHHRLLKEGRIFETSYVIHEVNSYYLKRDIIDPDQWNVGDTLIHYVDNDTIIGFYTLYDKRSTVTLDIGSFSRCYTLKSLQNNAYSFTLYTYAPHVGLVLEQAFFLDPTEDGYDTLTVSRKELTHYRLNTINVNDQLVPVTNPTPENLAVNVDPCEQAYSDIQDIPDSLLASYRDYLRSNADYTLYYFDYNESGEWEYSYLAWDAVESRVPVLYDIYTGTGDNLSAVVTGYYAANNNYLLWTEPNQTYTWRVDSRAGLNGAVVTGPTWTFSTRTLP